ncbi:PstS family phosphate ABC transporter substrate-binding protein [Fulvivirgaceae bacterium PWU4]|uniref:Phosphate-binding protein n=1 Tax=Chryseosolibacter histidini TaxID=2782349 RepID=A0AAP2DG88_9BACT|nr:PstS family phosphate ABC transporter substrate-binding protein [Chryseosolibacter histidini]MBT1695606.1 PstS family phosphate ABC transporter substrate-binding protein [Chryseosolibacter histidini]
MNFRPGYYLIAIGMSLLLTACGSKNSSESETEKLQGEIKIDGSSTVYPITEAVAEEFRAEQPEVKVTVGVSGTGGGFKKFGRGEIDINDASRPIKEQEATTCNENNIKYVDLKVAYDGLVIVLNKENTWVDHFTVAELKKIWEPEAQEKITKWNQIRASWPAEDFHLYGPGVASGTYDYFTEAIVGKSGSSRGDYTASEDDNVLVQGVSGDKNGIAFFGLAYYEENKERLKLVPVDNGKGAVTPSVETVKDGTYAPLARPVFVYVADAAAKRAEVSAFVNFYLNNAATLVTDVGYIPLTAEEYQRESAKFKGFSTAQ